MYYKHTFIMDVISLTAQVQNNWKMPLQKSSFLHFNFYSNLCSKLPNFIPSTLKILNANSLRDKLRIYSQCIKI